MEPRHVITQLIGTTVAVLVTRWGWREYRHDWRDERQLALVTGPYLGGRTLLVVVGLVVSLVPLLLVIVKLDLVDRTSPAQIIGMLAWISIGFLFVTFAVIARQARAAAKGWIRILGDAAICIEAEGTTATLTLRPGAARLRFIEDAAGPQFVQLDLEDGATRAHVWGMIGMRDVKLVTPGQPTEREGLMAASSLSPLCRWLAPYLTRN